MAVDSALRDNLPESDPAYPILAGILGIVPVSDWTYNRTSPNGDVLEPLASPDESGGTPVAADRSRRPANGLGAGPRIGPAVDVPVEFAGGVTLVFADERARYAVLTLFRTAALGPFTSAEISVLTFALDALSDRLSALRLAPAQRHPTLDNRAPAAVGPAANSEQASYVLDDDLRIMLAWSSQDQRRVALIGRSVSDRLPVVLEETVRGLTAGWPGERGAKCAGVARPVPFLLVHTVPMAGVLGEFIGVHLSRYVPPNSLTGAVATFHISPRERQVLALLLDGHHLEAIGRQLYITSSTVQDHINSMIQKTRTRNRTELIARILGWELPVAAHRPVASA